jgi:uncharacterized membrane protein
VLLKCSIKQTFNGLYFRSAKLKILILAVFTDIVLLSTKLILNVGKSCSSIVRCMQDCIVLIYPGLIFMSVLQALNTIHEVALMKCDLVQTHF